MKNWYTITNAAKAGAPAEISIFGPIGNTWDGEGVTARQFIADFQAIDAKEVTVSINSPGGSLFDGIAIYTAMAGSGKTITAKVMGIAASAASVIAMAASKITMPKNTQMMVHKAAWGAWGNADDLTAMVQVLNILDASIVATYAARTGRPEAEIKALLDTGDVWMSADEAVAAGFANEATELVGVTALFDTAKLPVNVQAMFKPPVTAPATAAGAPLAAEIEALATAAGLAPFASVIALDPSVVDVATAQAAIDAAKQIQAYAKLAGQDDRADPLIRARKTVPEARAILASNQAVIDQATYIDTSPPARKPAPAATATGLEGGTTALWKQINAMQAGSKK